MLNRSLRYLVFNSSLKDFIALIKYNKVIFQKSTIKDVNIGDLLPGLYGNKIELAKLQWEWGYLTHDDMLILLCLLVRYLKAQNIFEFGTFKGRTTVNLALNTTRSGHVYTLDLPSSKDINSNISDFERLYIDQLGEGSSRKVGRLFQDVEPDVRNRIIQLTGNSKEFDFSPYFGQFELIFIDGGHTYDVVASDTNNAFKMLSKKGIIVWDDYGLAYPEVKSYLDKLSLEKQLYRDCRTGLVIYIQE